MSATGPSTGGQFQDWREWSPHLIIHSFIRQSKDVVSDSTKIDGPLSDRMQLQLQLTRTIESIVARTRKIWNQEPSAIISQLNAANSEITIFRLHGNQLVALSKNPNCSDEALGKIICTLASDEVRYVELDDVLDALNESQRTAPLAVALQRMPPYEGRWMLCEILSKFPPRQAANLRNLLPPHTLDSILEEDRFPKNIWEIFKHTVVFWVMKCRDSLIGPLKAPKNYNICQPVVETHSTYRAKLESMRQGKDASKLDIDRSRLLEMRYYRQNNAQIRRHDPPEKIAEELRMAIVKNEVEKIERLVKESSNVFLSNPEEMWSRSLNTIISEIQAQKRDGPTKGVPKELRDQYYLYNAAQGIYPGPDLATAKSELNQISALQREPRAKEICDFIEKLVTQFQKTAFLLIGGTDDVSTFISEVQSLIIKRTLKVDELTASLTEPLDEFFPILVWGGWEGQVKIMQACEQLLKTHPSEKLQVQMFLRELLRQCQQLEELQYVARKKTPLPLFSMTELDTFLTAPIPWLQEQQKRLQQNIKQTKREAQLPFVSTKELRAHITCMSAQIPHDAFREQLILLEESLEIVELHVATKKWKYQLGEIATLLVDNAIQTGDEAFLKRLLKQNPTLKKIVTALELKNDIIQQMANVRRQTPQIVQLVRKPDVLVEEAEGQETGSTDPLAFLEKLNNEYGVISPKDLIALAIPGVKVWADLQNLDPKFLAAFDAFEADPPTASLNQAEKREQLKALINKYFQASGNA